MKHRTLRCAAETLVLLLIAAMAVFLAAGLHQRAPDGALSTLSTGWYQLTDGVRREVTLPAALETGPGQTITLYNDTLTDSDGGKVLSARGVECGIEIRAGETLLYRYEDNAFPKNAQMKGRLWADTELPYGLGGQTLSLTFTELPGRMCRIDAPVLGSMPAVTGRHIQSSLFSAGGWEQTPNTDPNGITGDVTYVYRFGSTGGGSSSGHSTRYTLHYESNGGTAYKDERCSSGTKVTLDKTPTRESYTFTGWYADRALTQKITSVTMNSDKTVYAGWEATGVPDKLNGDDHFAYVVGYSDGTVRPSANISRAEVATIFFRLLKSDIRDGNLTADNEFSDVSDGQWHNKAISTMAKLGIVKGRRADRFDPDASITRAEFAAICARFNTKPVENSGSFSDISGHWAENEIERAAAFGWISGYPNGTFRPDARITRAEAMTMINRVLCRMPQSKSDLLDSMVTWPDNKPSDWHYLAVQEATNSHDFDRQGEVGESWTKLTSVPDWTRYQ